MTESIDLFCHWLPPKFRAAVQARGGKRLHMFNRAAAMPALANLEARFRVMDEFPGYLQVPSVASPPVEAVAGGEFASELARMANDEQADMVASHPDRFVGFVAVLPMGEPDAAMREATRAIVELGALGVQVFSNVNGRPLDEPGFLEVIRHVAKLERLIWMHPTRGMDRADYPTETVSKFDLWWALGWPYETSAAMGRLVFSGILEDTPMPRIITHHAGGMIPMVEGRITSGLSLLGTRCPPGMEEVIQTPLRGAPVEMFKRFYADTATFGSRDAIKCAIDFFGINQVLFATDMPFDPEQGPGYIRSTLQAIAELDLDESQRQLILSGNARALCGLPVSILKG